MRLSIIVPAYNVADYIEKCIRSLEDQDIPKEDYEIIVTNDGSPDDCQAIIERLQKEFTNIVLINQVNQGVSMARNNAIAIAKGEYVMPMDPDDYLVANSLKAVINQAELNKLDVLYCAFEIFDINYQSIWRTNYALLSNRIDIGYDGYFAVRGSKVKDPDRSVGILYCMDLLREFKLIYPKDVPFLEDGLFLGKVFAVAKRVGYSNENFYQRTTRVGSATNSDLFYSQKAMNGFFQALKDINNFRSSQFALVSPILLNHLKVKFIFLILIPIIHIKDKDRYKAVNKIIKDKWLDNFYFDGVSEFYLTLIKIYKLSPIAFWYLYKPLIKIMRFFNV